MIQREWNVSLGSAHVSWGGVRATRTAAKETRGFQDGNLLRNMFHFIFFQVVGWSWFF